MSDDEARSLDERIGHVLAPLADEADQIKREIATHREAIIGLELQLRRIDRVLRAAGPQQPAPKTKPKPVSKRRAGKEALEVVRAAIGPIPMTTNEIHERVGTVGRNAVRAAVAELRARGEIRMAGFEKRSQFGKSSQVYVRDVSGDE